MVHYLNDLFVFITQLVFDVHYLILGGEGGGKGGDFTYPMLKIKKTNKQN